MSSKSIKSKQKKKQNVDIEGIEKREKDTKHIVLIVRRE